MSRNVRSGLGTSPRVFEVTQHPARVQLRGRRVGSLHPYPQNHMQRGRVPVHRLPLGHHLTGAAEGYAAPYGPTPDAGSAKPRPTALMFESQSNPVIIPARLEELPFPLLLDWHGATVPRGTGARASSELWQASQMQRPTTRCRTVIADGGAGTTF